MYCTHYTGAGNHYCRPQRSWGEVIFLVAHVKNSVHGGRGHVWRGGGRALRGLYMVGVCMVGGMHGGGSMHGGGNAWWGACMLCMPPGRYYGHGIRSMSGRYASYWNAFLFPIVPVLFPIVVLDPFPCSVTKPLVPIIVGLHISSILIGFEFLFRSPWRETKQFSNL